MQLETDFHVQATVCGIPVLVQPCRNMHDEGPSKMCVLF